ncbi:MAG: [FeFe] hydrogenase H-cluster radical SAM maturase HydG [Calditrichaeota bacterium]|nr:MAG: [FeFe] hydrogenase H-cluster radical SAM maturase HydG [Calditrichota bacterium]MBL1206234.1 [FeFe] hydrogenase H-cluster radical SAM maturase HydG [Calditrichota bacterium]NOG46060.1 [FeFe] hydrogenase H-cluster radical SAM maturase HydG [Calditrichota bacterium]
MYLDKTLSKNAKDFIDDDKIHSLLKNTKENPKQVKKIIAKSLEKKALNPEETAILLKTESPELVEEIFEAARKLKRDVYGNRIVLFAPLYIGNNCVNDCTYCSFRRSNKEAVRRTLSETEIGAQVESLEDKGHKRLILVYGEHPKYNADYIAKSVKDVYRVKKGNGEIRRVNINAAPMDIEGFKKIKEAGIGTYQIFMETYHHETYQKVHPENTFKGDYLWRLDGLNRANEAGLDDVGIGALFGLYDWRFEVLAMIHHSQFLEKQYGCGPHTISFPRLKPGLGIEYDEKYLVNDYNFKRLVAILRLAVPYAGMILTARESAELRKEILGFGVSQIDAGSRIELGGYTEIGDAQVQSSEKEQFLLSDLRPLDEVIKQLLDDDYIPSFCTSCYRQGRTGEQFMEFAIPGFIERLCTPNGLITLQEYLYDYSSEETKESGKKLIQRQLSNMPDSKMKTRVVERLNKIEHSNERDFYF